MKIKKGSKVIVIITSVVVLLLSFSMSAYAERVENSVTNIHLRYTALSNTRGYTEGNFTGTYYDNDSATNLAIVFGGCNGGPISTFTTQLNIRVYDSPSNGGESASTHLLSTEEGTRLLEAQVELTSTYLSTLTTGYVTAITSNKSDSDDSFGITYFCYWISLTEGWREA